MSGFVALSLVLPARAIWRFRQVNEDGRSHKVGAAAGKRLLFSIFASCFVDVSGALKLRRDPGDEPRRDTHNAIKAADAVEKIGLVTSHDCEPRQGARGGAALGATASAFTGPFAVLILDQLKTTSNRSNRFENRQVRAVNLIVRGRQLKVPTNLSVFADSPIDRSESCHRAPPAVIRLGPPEATRARKSMTHLAARGPSTGQSDISTASKLRQAVVN